MDADALIKLTKCGAKGNVVAIAEVSIPSPVKKETVDEAKARGYPDAVAIEENIQAGRLKVTDLDAVSEPSQAELFPTGGDQALFLAYHGGEWDAVVSDDSKLIRLLEAFGVPVLTPAALLVAMVKGGALTGTRVRGLLEALSPLVSAEEYATARLALEALRTEEGKP